VRPGHIMVRDPHKRAREFELLDSPLKTALRDLFVRLGKSVDSVPLLSEPCDREKHVIDAHPGGPCDACQRDVWLSPSSVETMKELRVVLLCMRCVEQAAGWPP
jgi:hypothetical protein